MGRSFLTKLTLVLEDRRDGANMPLTSFTLYQWVNLLLIVDAHYGSTKQ